MTEEEDRLERLRAVQIAAVTREILPEGIAIKCTRILNWNGDPPSPEITHWTNRGVFAIRALKSGKVVEVLFNERLLGLGDDDPQRTAYFLFKGNYDAELGFPASECVPPTLSEWNDTR